jgi:Domain of unknown function (DUF6438)
MRMRLPLFTALLLTACATVNSPAAAATPAAHTLVASLERGPCFGSCPAYAVRVYADGAVEFDGRRFTALTGHHTGSISAERLAELAAAFKAAAFSTLKPEYTHATVTDMPYLTISDGTKTVRHALGDEHAPASLVTLESAIDQAVTISQWVDGPTQ